MSSKFKALIFDLGGVLLKWNPKAVTALSSTQFRSIMNSNVWFDLDRGVITLHEACKHFGAMLSVDSSIVKYGLEEAQRSLAVNKRLSKIAQEIKESDPSVKLVIMSNISREHFDIVRNLDLPWSVFDYVFASGAVGMLKPDLCFFQHVVDKIGTPPHQIVMVDDEADNICAARSVGIHGILVDNSSHMDVGKTVRNLFLDPISRAEKYMENNAANHDSVVEERNIVIKDNFSQLLIWELTGDADIIYLKCPSGKMQGHDITTNGTGSAIILVDHSKIENGFWNYFYSDPILTTSQFPSDTDTTSTAYLSVPECELSNLADVNLVMDEMARNTSQDGIMQTYFCDDRPRTSPEVCCNILRVFHRFGQHSNPRIRRTEEWVVQCLRNRAYRYGSRVYSVPEAFLYFAARLYVECGRDDLKRELEAVKEALLERINLEANPLALALRISACQLVGLDRGGYKQDLNKLKSMQEEDGGWPAGHLCCIGRTGDRIGNRGLTTALALKIIRYDERLQDSE